MYTEEPLKTVERKDRIIQIKIKTLLYLIEKNKLMYIKEKLLLYYKSDS